MSEPEAFYISFDFNMYDAVQAAGHGCSVSIETIVKLYYAVYDLIRVL